MGEKNCDVVVIGSGIGGMCAAAKLAHSGFRVIVLEKAPILGGRYTTLDYKGCKVPTGGLSVLQGVNSPTWHTIEEVKAPKPEMRESYAARYVLGGKTFEMGLGEQDAFQRLLEFVGGKADAPKVLSALDRAMRWQEPSDTMSVRDWLMQYTSNEGIHKILHNYAQSFSAINANEFPAGEFIRVLKHLTAAGTSALYAKNGLKDIIDALDQAIKRDKGEVLTDTNVTGVVIKDWVATGVIGWRRRERIEVEAGAVISDIGPRETIKLVGEQNFEQSYLKEVRERIKPTGIMDFVFLSDKPLVDFEGALVTLDNPGGRMHTWVTPTVVCPEWAPEGKHLNFVWITPPNTLKYDPKQEHGIFLKDAKYRFPNLEKYGAKLLCSRNYFGQWPCARTPQGSGISCKTPVENLYNAGDGVGSPGFSLADGAAASGVAAAGLITASMKP